MNIMKNSTEVYVAVLYADSDEMNKTDTSKLSERMGLIEFNVCDRLNLAVKAIVTTLLDKRFVYNSTGMTGVFLYVSFISDKTLLLLTPLFQAFDSYVYVYSNSTVDFKYSGMMRMNTYPIDLRIANFVKSLYPIENIAAIFLLQSKMDLSYLGFWKTLISINPNLCITRYNIVWNDERMMMKVIYEIKESIDIQSVIVNFDIRRNDDVESENAGVGVKLLIQTAHYLNLQGKAWVVKIPRFQHVIGVVHSYEDNIFNNTIFFEDRYDAEMYRNKTPQLLLATIIASVDSINYFETIACFSRRTIIKLISYHFYPNMVWHCSNTYDVADSVWRCGRKCTRTCIALFAFDEEMPKLVHSSQRGEHCRKAYCQTGYEPKFEEKGTNLSTGRVHWFCIKCVPMTFKDLPGIQKCTNCPLFTKSNINRTMCKDLLTNQTYDFKSGMAIAIFSISVLCGVSTIFFIKTFAVYRKTPIVRSSNKALSLIQLAIHFILFVIPAVTITHESIPFLCRCRHLIIGYAMIILSAITLIKKKKLSSYSKQ